MAKSKNALPVTRSEDFAQWYQAVIHAADMAEMSGVRGCMIIKPWGYRIWERIQAKLDDAIQATGHENCYFPIFVPIDLLEKEASHVEGFAKEMAVVTHHRLELKDGKLVPAAPLEAPLVVRPTSEAMITPAFKRWIQSYRDLPIKINQWCNVVRWEMRPRLFLRTSEFLWQEGHTAHATGEEAIEEARMMLWVYRDLAQDVMALPVIAGTKSPGERFPGAVDTYTIEGMMQDGRALQAGTSHYLGQNFAKAADIDYLDREGQRRIVHTTSWGASTRLIGATIMTHGDDDGLRLPPRLAPFQVVIVPILRNQSEEQVLRACDGLAQSLREKTYAGEPVRVYIDQRDDSPTEKRWRWLKKGVPFVCELGPRDVPNDEVAVHWRLDLAARAVSYRIQQFVSAIPYLLETTQTRMWEKAEAYLHENTVNDIETFDDLKAFFDTRLGFVRGKWCETTESEEKLRSLGVTIRCIPFDQSGTQGRCVVTGELATTDAIFAKAY